MAFANGANDAYDQMIQVEPGIWLIPGVAYHYLKAKARYNAEQGRSFYSTEGFRPIGSPSDFDNGVGNTQWFYWVRKQRQPWQPAGAYPGGSMHGWGRAVDVNLNLPINYSRMRAFMEDEGFEFDILDEEWHANYYKADMWTSYDMSGLNYTPIGMDDMYDDAARTELIGDRIDKTMIPLLRLVLANQGNDDAQIDRVLDATRREGRARLFHNLDTGERIAINLFTGWHERISLGTDDGRGHIAALRDKEFVGDAYENSRGYHQVAWDTLLEDAGIDPATPAAPPTV